MFDRKLIALAWRNLWRNRRRTLITLFGIAFGSMLAVLATGIGDSSYASMIDRAAEMSSGHVTVQHPEFVDLPSATKTVENAEAAAAEARSLPQVRAAVVRQQGSVMLATARQSSGTYYIGIDPEQETPATLETLEQVVDGEMFPTASGGGIVLGEALAENLGAKLGKRVVYTVTDKQGEIVSGLARVRGIVRTGIRSVDASLCYLPLDTVRETLGYGPAEATTVAVFVEDNRQSDATAAALAAKLGTTQEGGPAVLTWKESQPQLRAFIDMKVNGTLILEAIIMLLLAAGIFNSLFVSVMERLREFGIMLAIGFTTAQLFALVMWESLFLAVSGLLAAVVVTAAPYYHLSTTGIDTAQMYEGGVEVAGVGMDAVIYCRIYPESVAAMVVIIVVATLVAGLYPAWRAGRVQPAIAIKEL